MNQLILDHSGKQLKTVSFFQTIQSAVQLKILFLLFFGISVFSRQSYAQGTWVPIASPAPDTSFGQMLLLTDGSVIVKTSFDTTSGLLIEGNVWDRLVPDIHGSYVNGTWSRIAPMHVDRYAFSSLVLKDGRVYVAGGEYGGGHDCGEVYDPVTNTWTYVSPWPILTDMLDANCELLPDGTVLQAAAHPGIFLCYFDPVSMMYTMAPSSYFSQDESTWLKLPDNSILYVDLDTTTSERYIPSIDTWVQDGIVPVSLYDSFEETGPAFVLPDGNAFFLGSQGYTAYYMPSGNTSPGTWLAGPPIPDNRAASDACGAMMVDGKIICEVAKKDDNMGAFYSPTYFYEFDYLTNTFTLTHAPPGGDSMISPAYNHTMLALPDGHILFSSFYSKQYYEYIPAGPPLPAGKPSISSIIKISCDTFMATGTLFNGITEGASYGDDCQMATNYPIIRLTSGSNVYYARTFNWNRTGLRTGSLLDTTWFSLPLTLPMGTYSLYVVANGNPSAPVSFSTCGVGVEGPTLEKNDISLSPNPTNKVWNIGFTNNKPVNYFVTVVRMTGQLVYQAENSIAIDASAFPPGIYFVDVYFDHAHYYLQAVKN